MSTPLAKRIAEEHAALAERLPSSLPTTRDENWKYANLRPLDRVRFAPAQPSPIDPAALPAAIEGYARFVFVDGVFNAALSSDAAPCEGVTVRSLGGAARAGEIANRIVSKVAKGTAVSADGMNAPANGAAANVEGARVSAGGANAPANFAASSADSAAASANGVRAHATASADSVRAPASAGSAASTKDVRAHASASIATSETPIDQSFAHLNEAFATDGAEIKVAAGSRSKGCCIELLFVATAESSAGASYPRINLELEANAQLSLIERHLSQGSAASFVNSAVNVVVQKQSNLSHYRVQQVSPTSTWVDTLSASIATDATYRVNVVEIGALSSRSTVQIKLAGERADLGFHVVSLGERNQVHDTYALVDHAAPRARTEESFRGIAGGRSRVAFNGKIIVREGAHGTDTRQSLRGLLAGKESEIDVRPQLEIYTDDVKCSHGATAGKLDDNMLFYLLSRGLDRDTALKLLKWAFLEDVVSKISVPELRKQIEQSLAGQLQDVGELKELV